MTPDQEIVLRMLADTLPAAPPMPYAGLPDGSTLWLVAGPWHLSWQYGVAGPASCKALTLHCTRRLLLRHQRTDGTILVEVPLHQLCPRPADWLTPLVQGRDDSSPAHAAARCLWRGRVLAAPQRHYYRMHRQLRAPATWLWSMPLTPAALATTGGFELTFKVTARSRAGLARLLPAALLDWQRQITRALLAPDQHAGCDNEVLQLDAPTAEQLLARLVVHAL